MTISDAWHARKAQTLRTSPKLSAAKAANHIYGKEAPDEKTPVWRLMSGEQVAKVAAVGMEIGSHSVTHPRLRGIGTEQLRTEVAMSKSSLSELVDHPVQGFAYPFGSMDAAAREAVRKAGYDYACAVETPIANLGITVLSGSSSPNVTVLADGGQEDILQKLYGCPGIASPALIQPVHPADESEDSPRSRIRAQEVRRNR